MIQINEPSASAASLAGPPSGSEPAYPGLTTAQAAQRLQQQGFNELPATRRRTLLHLVFEVLREPMFLLLLGAGAVYLVLGDPGDAAMLLGFVVMAMAITIVQERRTERVLETLRDLASPRALVMRDGEQRRIPGREVVRDDLLVLEEGDRVAADGVLLDCHDLLIDESLLSGESLAVAKEASASVVPADASPLSPQQVYSGSMVVQGGGLARVTATGPATQIGAIGRALQAIPSQPSPLQREIRSLVQGFALFGLSLSLLIFVIFGWLRHDWLNGLLVGMTLAMSLLPEEFTVILTVFMALGAWRISKNQVLTRHTPVIEALGSATVLCSDKTGTLTHNRMAVSTVVLAQQSVELGAAGPASLPQPVEQVLRCAVLASETTPFDPMEKAFHRCWAQWRPQSPAAPTDWSFVHEYPLTRELLAMTHVWRRGERGDDVVASKGAPEAMVSLCRLGAERSAAVMQQVDALAARGMRVLGVAQAAYAAPAGSPWPLSPQAFDFQFLGLVGLADPLRPAVPQAVQECQQAGIRVVMITGDHPATALAIARQAGLAAERVITGAQLASLTEAELRAVVGAAPVFARIAPEQKLSLVQALKANGEIVAMTGDGVNDAPALKAAHIGISMGEHGTDVAREASDLVLLDDDFTSIVRTIKLGRRIYDNLRKALTYVVAVHVPIAGMTLLPLLLGTPMAFAPVHIVFLEMVINPACAIVFETEAAESDSMHRPPRRPSERLFGARNVLLAVLQGLGLLALVALVFFGGLRSGLQDDQARALAFAALVLGNLGLIVTSRSLSHHVLDLLRRPNRAQWWMLGGTSVALAAVLYVPPLQRAFHFLPVAPPWLLWPVLAGVAALAWCELVKWFDRVRH